MLLRTKILNIVLAPLVVLVAIVLVRYWIQTKPEPPSRPPREAVPRVEILSSKAIDAAPTIETFGNVRSFYDSQIASQVTGEVLSVSPQFRVGEAVAEGDVLVSINPADYLATVALQESALASAQETLEEEKSLSRIAREDWLASGRKLDEAPDFTLRIPQLEAAEKAVASSEAALEKAKLDHERTQIRAPFDAIVQERSTSPGNVLTMGTVVGRLIARDRAEVRLPLTPQQVRQLNLPVAFDRSTIGDLQATLTTPSQPGKSWKAQVVRTDPIVDTQNQVLYVIAEIPEPFEKPEGFLPIGAFVNVTLSGSTLKSVHRLPESALIEDRFVWIIDGEDQLQRQTVQRVAGDGGDFLARIPDLPASQALRVAVRPLVSFKEGERVRPFDPAAQKQTAEQPPTPIP